MYFTKLGKEKAICAAPQELVFAPKGCSRVLFMGRKSFLCAAVAGKVKAEKSCWKGLIAGYTYRGREGEVSNAHTERGIARCAPREGEDEPVA